MAKILHNGDAVILGNGGLIRIHKISVSGITIKPSEFFKLSDILYTPANILEKSHKSIINVRDMKKPSDMID